MSDVSDEAKFLGRQLVRKSQTNELRARMETFVSEHEPPESFKERRAAISGETPLSELVDEGRKERL